MRGTSAAQSPSMKGTGLRDGRALGTADGIEPTHGGAALPVPMTSTNVDGEDVEARHRLRRALRILLAARRRDDGGAGHIDG